MSGRAPTSPRGYSALEVLVAAAGAVMFLLVVTQLLSTSREVVEQGRGSVHAAAQNRRGLEAIASVLRCAAVDSLAGFDAGGTATSPSFTRAVGADGEQPEAGPLETLEWRASTWPGAGTLGAIWLARPDGDRLVADRVPAGGFFVHRTGRRLDVELTTSYPSGTTQTTYIHGLTSVTARN